MGNYDPKKCDLCGSDSAKVLTGNNKYNIGMTSDKNIQNKALNKIKCNVCGLVRDGNRFSYEELEHHYGDQYSLHGIAPDMDHLFYKDGQYITRSKATSDWIIESLISINPLLKSSFENIFEVGAGQGNLLLELKHFFRNSTISGIEMTKTAVSLANQKGVSLQQGDYTCIKGKFDLILAVTVIEHVPSPHNFLQKLSAHLTDKGYILIIQPMQNVESYDIFFIDHLYHFHTKHIEWFGLRAGLNQVLSVESPWFAKNFSLHLFRKSEEDIQQIELEYVETTVTKTLWYWDVVFDRISKHEYKNKKYAIYGLGEISSLMYVYSDLKNFTILFGIDDTGKYKKSSNLFNVPVKSFDEVNEKDCNELDGVIIAVNPMYHRIIEEKCSSKRMNIINFLSDI